MDGEQRRSHCQRRGRKEEYRCELDNGLHRYENANLESKAVCHLRRIAKNLALRAWVTVPRDQCIRIEHDFQYFFSDLHREEAKHRSMTGRQQGHNKTTASLAKSFALI